MEALKLLSTLFPMALAAGINVIMCCGEMLDERKAGKTDDVIKAQVEKFPHADMALILAESASFSATAFPSLAESTSFSESALFNPGTARSAAPPLPRRRG